MYCTHYIPSVLICICTINKDKDFFGGVETFSGVVGIILDGVEILGRL